MSYRTCWLKKTPHSSTGNETEKFLDNIKRLDISLKYHLFSIEDPVQLFIFSAALAEEFYTLDVSEAPDFLVLPYMLQ